MKSGGLFLVLVLLSACSGKQEYVRPAAPQNTSNSVTVDRPRDAVWNATVPELGKQFFVINNLDKSSGLINISYTGDPEKYVDCGEVTSYVRNLRGERTYKFPASKAQQAYEVMDKSGNLFFIDRKMSLEGRVNLIFEEVTKASTRITANTRYVLTRQITTQGVMSQIPHSSNDSISFNSNGKATFPGDTECVATGKLEQDILSAVK